MKLLVLESPSKRKTIQGILGRGWQVEASFGHVTELANDGPDNLGFEIGPNSVTPSYVPRGKRGKSVLTKLRKLSRKADAIYIATDPDREGESIGWHIVDQLSLPSAKTYRVRYSEITESAIKRAIDQAAPAIDQDLADAARARQVLDKLVGYKVSPLLWDSTGGKSAGRVQSAALAILCRREKEIREFEPRPYWTVWVQYAEGFKASFLEASVAPEPDSDSDDDDAADGGDRPIFEGKKIWDESYAQHLAEIAKESPHSVNYIKRREIQRCSPKPFTTSTLQQAAGSRLRLSTDRVMKLAQQLFEGIDLPQGRKSLITYHRTDSPTLSEEFKQTAKAWLQDHDPDNVPEQMPSYSAKKGAQEAHEAIRPTYLDITPDSIKGTATNGQYQLYRLIWNRAIAACCRSAKLDKTRIVTESGGVQWEARGQVVTFSGYSKYWDNLGKDQQLPEVREGQSLNLPDTGVDSRKTSPPPRYSEAKLVQTLERLGIGRPSTFAATVQTLKLRKYARGRQRKLAPTQLGMETYHFLSQTLPDLLDSEFTAEMEADLDAIAEGKKDWEEYLCKWHQGYFKSALRKAQGYADKHYDSPQDNLPEDELTHHSCPVCKTQLEKHFYTKDGEKKAMLRCSQKAKSKCDDVAYFWTRREQWWSPEFGELRHE